MSAAMLVVSHMNDVAPTGAEQAVDETLGGLITRRAVALRDDFGATHFLPTSTSPLPAGCVLVVSLGDAELFTPSRLPEAGAAIVDAAASIGVRDAATVIHGAGLGGIDPKSAATELISGVLAALERVPGGAGLRELTVAENDPGRLKTILEGVQEAVTSPGVHVYVEEALPRRTVAPERSASAATDHLRLGISRSGPDLRITTIGSEAFDPVGSIDFPGEVATRLPESFAEEVLLEEDHQKRATAMVSIGAQLFKAFLGTTDIDVADLIGNAPDGMIVLRLDQWTIDLPWELLHSGEEFTSWTRRLARQVELPSNGRQAAFSQKHDRLCALVVGDPTEDLESAAREAVEVAKSLRDDADAEVTELIGGVSYADLSRELDSRSFDILHYAGHAAFVEGRSDASGLRLQDHLLTPDDFATRRFLPRLVIANACHSAATGRGTGDPYEGNQETRTLVSGLLGAGARAFIGAMWQVDDEAAATFARRFYQAVAPVGEGPQAIGEAVRLARRAVVEAHGEGEPAWAAYALYGQPWRRGI